VQNDGSRDKEAEKERRMKSLWVKSGVFFVVIGLAILWHVEAWGADWKFFSSTDLYECFYYADNVTYKDNSMKHSSTKIVEVWIKLEYTEKGVAEMVKKFGKHYGPLSYSLQLWEINCVTKKQHVLLTKEYSGEGNILNTKPPKGGFSSWKSISKGSVGESLLKAVCK
jgi:hypothetical protein